jgi:acyl-homoserine lactone acylase PvdQ
MKIKDKQITLAGTAGKIRIKRMQGGFPRIDADDELHINNAGGPSDRRFSKYYTMGLKAWMKGEYEVFKP